LVLEDMDRLVVAVRAYRLVNNCLDLTVFCNQDYTHWFYQIDDSSVPHPVYKYPHTARVELTPECNEYDIADDIMTQLTGE